ncbi:hypothetical protein QO006_001706 [Deinococcus enclensis]|uniref:Uncharacterized protein n=1 Tax=Deinococcus enclensis TaxID=1049582 RepID=A0ABT9MCI0_9DEIO|nr:hypothetical protein [Deinococcus enclensis]
MTAVLLKVLLLDAVLFTVIGVILWKTRSHRRRTP